MGNMIWFFFDSIKECFELKLDTIGKKFHQLLKPLKAALLSTMKPFTFLLVLINFVLPWGHEGHRNESEVTFTFSVPLIG